jgi:hypothetical protein
VSLELWHGGRAVSSFDRLMGQWAAYIDAKDRRSIMDALYEARERGAITNVHLVRCLATLMDFDEVLREPRQETTDALPD